MKIWVIGLAYPTKKNQMLGSFEFDQAEMFSKHGHDVTFFAVDLRSLRRWRHWGVHKFEAGGG